MKDWMRFMLPLGLLFAFQKVRAQVSAPPKIYDIVNSLPVHPNDVYGLRTLGQIHRFVIHHSGTLSGSAQSYATYHVNTHGWPGIGYHFVIDKDGRINQTQLLTTISYHVPGFNTNSVGICLTGDFTQHPPTAAQLDSVVYLVRFLSLSLGQKQVVGHGELVVRTCPGNLIDVHQIETLAYSFT